jgi:hypothetical protein
MSPDARRRHEPLMDHLAAIDADGFFELVVDRAVAAIEELVAKE